jgi:hypothetical protein
MQRIKIKVKQLKAWTVHQFDAMKRFFRRKPKTSSTDSTGTEDNVDRSEHVGSLPNPFLSNLSLCFPSASITIGQMFTAKCATLPNI